MPQDSRDPIFETKLKLVREAIACTEEEASMALEGAGGDVHGALRLLDLIVKEVLIIKFRFEGRRAATVSGIGYIIANTRSGKLLSANTVVTYRVALPVDITPNLSWRVIEETIVSLRASSDINLNATMDLDGHLLMSLQPWRIDELGRMASESAPDALTEAIRSEVSRSLKEDLRVEVDYELLTRVQYSGQIETPHEAQKILPDMEQSEAEQGNGLSVFLQSELLIAPIDGQTVESLAPGQTALVRVTDDSQIGSYLATLLGGRRGPELVPLAVPVSRVEELPSGRLRVEFNFGPGIMGKALCDKGIKVRVVRPEAPNEVKPTMRLEWVVLAVAAIFLLIGLVLRLG